MGSLWVWKLFCGVHTYLFKWTSPKITTALSYLYSSIQPWFISNRLILLPDKAGDFAVWVYEVDKKICFGKLQEIDDDDDDDDDDDKV